MINVFFYNDSTKVLIDNKWIDNGATAQVTWSSLTRGTTYTFFARGQDNNGAWGENSDVQTFTVVYNIYINGDDNFTVANGVTSGSGTAVDPWIIENYIINAENENGISIWNTTEYFIIRNCLIENGGSSHDGIYLCYADNGIIDNNIIDNCDSGIHLRYSTYDNLINNICENCDSDGIYLSFSTNNVVSGNTCENNDDGIYVPTDCNNNTIDNNTFSNNDYGIDMVFADNNSLTNNKYSNNTHMGIQLWDCDNNNIENNVCDNNGWRGIDLYLSENCVIDNNTCDNNIYYGILIYDSCDNAIITNNTCDNNAYHGIYIYESDNFIVENNVVENNVKYGIYVVSSYGGLLFHNYLWNNTDNNAWDNGANAWDYGGEGNYWSDWQPPEHPDVNHDNIIDSPRPIENESNQDNFPLRFGNISPNKPENLSPSTRQTTTSVLISCQDVDNDGDNINVFFYEDNATHSLIDNIWITSGGTATRTWGSLTRGTTYAFFARGQDSNGAWSDNSDVCSFTINSLPTVPTISLNSPKVEENLVVSASSTDVDNDPITYWYKFYNENHSSTRKDWSTDNFYTIVAADNHDNIMVYVRASDGLENSADNSLSFIIANSPPSKPTLLTRTSIVYVGSTLIASASGSTDNDGDNVYYYYLFYNDNLGSVVKNWSTDNTYAIAGSDNHDNIRIFARGYDNRDYGDNIENSIIVSNTGPTVPTKCLLTSPVYVGSQLLAIASGSTDNDGDNLVYYYEFYDVTDSVTKQAYSSVDVYTLQISDAHDNIRVRAKALDNYEYSEIIENSENVSNVKPTMSIISIGPSTIYVGTNLAASGTSIDNDNDSLTYYYKFYNVDKSTIRQNWNTTSSYVIQSLDAHNTIRIYAKAFDGYENSDENSADMSVSNTLPTTPITLTLSSPVVSGVVFTATASGSTDIDGDTITYYYKFYNQTDDNIRKDWSASNTYTPIDNDIGDMLRVYTKANDGYGDSGVISAYAIVGGAGIAIVYVNVDNTLIDRKKDYFSSNAITQTKITVRAQDNENRDCLTSCLLSIRDNASNIILDNDDISTSYENIDDYTKDYYYLYNPDDAMSDSSLGGFSVKAIITDNYGDNAYENFIETKFYVDDLAVIIENIINRENYTVKGKVSRVSGLPVTINQVTLVDNTFGNIGTTLISDNYENTYQPIVDNKVYSWALANSALDGLSDNLYYQVTTLTVENKSLSGTPDNATMWIQLKYADGIPLENLSATLNENNTRENADSDNKIIWHLTLPHNTNNINLIVENLICDRTDKVIVVKSVNDNVIFTENTTITVTIDDLNFTIPQGDVGSYGGHIHSNASYVTLPVYGTLTPVAYVTIQDNRSWTVLSGVDKAWGLNATPTTSTSYYLRFYDNENRSVMYYEATGTIYVAVSNPPTGGGGPTTPTVTTYTIYFNVVDITDNTPIMNASVDAINLGAIYDTEQTDNEGRTWLHVTQGTWDFRAYKEGYLDATITDINIVSSRSFYVSLTPAPPPPESIASNVAIIAMGLVVTAIIFACYIILRKEPTPK